MRVIACGPNGLSVLIMRARTAYPAAESLVENAEYVIVSSVSVSPGEGTT